VYHNLQFTTTVRDFRRGTRININLIVRHESNTYIPRWYIFPYRDRLIHASYVYYYIVIKSFQLNYVYIETRARSCQ
jgi:hypothetical protein